MRPDPDSLNAAAFRRGFPRNAVATVTRSEFRVFRAECKKALILLGILNILIRFHLRGTVIAKGVITMTTRADVTDEHEGKPVLSSDWVDAHADYLFNFAVGQVQDINIAEDLVQETFLAAVKASDTFCGQSSERTWLVGILRHKIYDHLRKACRERAARHEATPRTDAEDWEEAVLWLHDVAVESQLPSHRMELAEFRTNLELALGKLPPRIAQVFQLYEIEERPNREVCARMNISESNLWVMLHRARKQLREQLGGWWFGVPAQNTSEAGDKL